MKLLSLRAARVGSEELCAVDTTTRSAYGSSLADIKWGHNKEGMPLEQTNEVVMYTLTQHMPIYYRTLPGANPSTSQKSPERRGEDHGKIRRQE